MLFTGLIWFPGNPTKSYRTQESLRSVGEVVGWKGQSSGMAGAFTSFPPGSPGRMQNEETHKIRD
ncbi:MAG: hypothetical protein HFI67_10070 [Lachnospiraceae bacterium]|nr:hypothetical protein [Lachnospiraceae bacterium]